MYDRQKLEEIRQALEKWEETKLQQTQARFPERQEKFITTSSEPIERLYTPLDIQDLDYAEDGEVSKVRLDDIGVSDPALSTDSLSPTGS